MLSQMKLQILLCYLTPKQKADFNHWSWIPLEHCFKKKREGKKKNSVMDIMKLDSYVTQSHNIKMYLLTCVGTFEFCWCPAISKSSLCHIKQLKNDCCINIIYIQMYINDSPENLSFTRRSTYASYRILLQDSIVCPHVLFPWPFQKWLLKMFNLLRMR